jgi:hypothetical protein
MGRLSLVLGLVLFGQAGMALAEEEESEFSERVAPSVESAPARSDVAESSKPRFQLGVALLPVLQGSLTTVQSGGAETSSQLDSTYGVGLSFSYRVLAGLSLGIAPQVVLHLTSKDDAGYPVIDSEKEYDLMARIAYAYPVMRNLEVYVEVLPGYSFVTYNKIVVGSRAPMARGIVGAAGLGAAFSVTERFFVNAGVGYQLGFQVSHGISTRDVSTRFLRTALGGGVKF